MRNKNYLAIFFLAMLVLIISAFLLKTYFKKPPIIKFVDEDNAAIDGTVYLDYAQIGETENGEFKNLPKDYCETTHNLALKTAESRFEFSSYPIDCKSKVVSYIVKIKTIEK